MRKRIIFCICFFLILIIPVITMNTDESAVSELDNEYLPEIEWDINQLEQIGTYVEKRIGGRNQAILAYEVFNDKVFGILEHPLYMYGENEWVYFKEINYVEDYLRINVDEQYAEAFAQYMKKLDTISGEKQIDFLYVMCVDKKTIYPEHFPNGVHAKDGESRADIIFEEIQDLGINCFCTKETLLQAKESGVQVYNQKYDAGHWNEDGAFLACKDIYEILNEFDSRIPLLDEADYNRSMITEPYLLTSEFPINESVPYYERKESHAVADESYDELMPGEKVYFRHYENTDIDAPKILIFRDSYIDMVSKFFIDNFSETTFASYGNLTSIEDFETYLDILNPDIVIFENAERTFPLQIPE